MLIRLCVFDLDGTLVNSIADIADAGNRALRKMNKKEHKIEDYLRFVGNGMEMICRRALGNGTEEEVRTMLDLYKGDYLENCCVKTSSYPGIDALLDSLKREGVFVGILTNKPQEQTDVVVRKVFGSDKFAMILGAGSRFPKKPNPESLEYMIKYFEVSKEETIMVGDSDVDMELSCRAGVRGVGVSWGFRGREELENAGASFIANDTNELYQYIEKEIK